MCNLNAVAPLVFVSQDITYKSVIEARAELDKEKQDAIDDVVINIARKMIKENCDIELILKVTGLSEEEVTSIKLKYIEDAGKTFE